MADLSLPIPVELIDTIFDYLHPQNFAESGSHSKSELKACSLVSRRWYSIARPHVFREVYRSYRHLGRNISDASPSERSFAGLYVYLANSPVIAQSIQKLRLQQEREYSGLAVALAYDDFLSLLDLMPHLQELSLLDITVLRLPQTVYPPNQRSLAKLHIEYYSTNGFPRVGVQEMIACAGKIDTLDMEGLHYLSWEDQVHPPHSKGPAPLALEPTLVSHITFGPGLLQVDVREASFFASCITSCIRADTIRSIRLDTRFGLSAYTALLQSIGADLEQVRIDIDPFLDEVLIMDPCLILPCVHLRELIISVELNDTFELGDLGLQLRFLHDFFTDSRLALSHYPNLTDVILEASLSQRWLLEDGDYVDFSTERWHWTRDTDAYLVSIVENTSVSAITVQWAPRTQQCIGSREISYVKSLFPALSRRDMLVFRDVY